MLGEKLKKGLKMIGEYAGGGDDDSGVGIGGGTETPMEMEGPIDPESLSINLKASINLSSFLTTIFRHFQKVIIFYGCRPNKKCHTIFFPGNVDLFVFSFFLLKFYFKKVEAARAAGTDAARHGIAISIAITTNASITMRNRSKGRN